MIASTVTCDKCGLSIEPRDEMYRGVGEMVTLYYNSMLGHNQVPLNGWQFHYSCFSVVVAAVLSVLPSKPPSSPPKSDRPNPAS